MSSFYTLRHKKEVVISNNNYQKIPVIVIKNSLSSSGYSDFIETKRDGDRNMSYDKEKVLHTRILGQTGINRQ